MTSPPGNSAHPALLSKEDCHSGLEGAGFSPNKQCRVTSGLPPGPPYKLLTAMSLASQG